MFEHSNVPRKLMRYFFKLFAFGTIWLPQTGSLHLLQTALTLLMLDFEALCPAPSDFVIQVLHRLATLSYYWRW